MKKITARIILKGGEGSGFHGHAGRPGLVGGSAGGKGKSDVGVATESDNKASESDNKATESDNKASDYAQENKPFKRPLSASSLAKVVGSNRPQYSRHSTYVKLTAKGRDIIEWLTDNAPEYPSGKWFRDKFQMADLYDTFSWASYDWDEFESKIASVNSEFFG